jgi:hypothetical protein
MFVASVVLQKVPDLCKWIVPQPYAQVHFYVTWSRVLLYTLYTIIIIIDIIIIILITINKNIIINNRYWSHCRVQFRQR